MTYEQSEKVADIYCRIRDARWRIKNLKIALDHISSYAGEFGPYDFQLLLQISGSCEEMHHQQFCVRITSSEDVIKPIANALTREELELLHLEQQLESIKTF